MFYQYRSKLEIKAVMNNQMALERRKKELEEIKMYSYFLFYRVSGKVNALSNNMAIQTKVQGDMINALEENIAATKVNVENADKEIIEAEQISKSTNRKTKWFIAIGIFVALAVIGTVLGIVLSRK